jgi:FtsP/CotA-like multicopper oxidase with cupredoxin domain
VGLLGCGDDTPGQVKGSFEKRLPFVEPPELTSEDGVLDIDLTSAPGDLDVSGNVVRGEAYNGTFVGPTLRIEPGDEIRLALDNQLDQHTNVHFHGFFVSPSGISDNVLRHIPPGETEDYLVQVPSDHDQGVFWYHSHLHFDAESQVFQGLSGAILIGDTRRLLPERFADVPRRLLALKDLQVKDGAIVAANIDSDAPTTRTVNGLVEPEIQIQPGATEVWDIANIGADIFYDVELEGITLLVLGEDGNPVEQTFEASHLVMPPGKRFEVLVTFEEEGDVLFKTRSYDQQGDQYPETPLAHVEVGGESVTTIEPLGEGESLIPEDDLLEREVVAERTWTFTEDDETSKFYINDKQFDEDRVDVSPTLDTVEEWTLVNDTSEQHPFHIHVNDFKVLSVDGEPYESHGKQDTVILPPKKPVVVRIPFDRFTGKFVFHCHILNHEDHGMMALVDVVE